MLRSAVLERHRGAVYFADKTDTKLDHYVLQSSIAPFSHRSDEYDCVVFRWLAERQIDLVYAGHIARARVWSGRDGQADRCACGVFFPRRLHRFANGETVGLPRAVLRRDLHGQRKRLPPRGFWPVETFGGLKQAAIGSWRAQFGTMPRC